MSEDPQTEPRDYRAQRRTWVVGGVLLLLSVAAGIAARGSLADLSPAKDWLFAAAGIIFAIGLGRAGSVTGRRFFGTVSTILMVVAPLTQSYWFTLLPDYSDNPNAGEDAWVLVATAYFGTVAVLTVIAVVAIGLARVVPSPWRWAPLWLMIWTLVTFWTGLTIFGFAVPSPVTSFGAILSGYAPAAGVAFLGILSIVLGLRRTSSREAGADLDVLPRPADPARGR